MIHRTDKQEVRAVKVSVNLPVVSVALRRCFVSKQRYETILIGNGLFQSKKNGSERR